MFRKIVFTFISLGIGSALLFMTISSPSVSLAVGEELASLRSGETLLATLESESVILTPLGSGSTRKPTEYLFQNLGKLSFVFLDPKSASLSTGGIKTTSENIMEVGSDRYMFGLYDPFEKYTIRHPDYEIEPITNGSLFLNTESDGTIVIYSTDIVARLHFLSDKKKMTDIVLFPGNYIRFDPVNNQGLDGANLFRIIQVLGGANQTLEYRNPRAEQTNSADTFRGNDRRDRDMIRMMSFYLRAKVENITEIVKKYKALDSFSGVQEASSFINPGKKNYYLLLGLSTELAQSISTEGGTGSMIRITDIFAEGNKKNMGDAIQKTLQQFIIDGRFAIYGNHKQQGLDRTYNEIASLIGVVPETQKVKILQDLSNLYTKNIVSVGAQRNISLGDVNMATASILQEFLSPDSGLDTKDLLSLSFYTHHILRTFSATPGVFDPTFLETQYFYIFEEVFLRASMKYTSSLRESAMIQATRDLFAKTLYKDMFPDLSSGILQTFTMKDANGFIYLKPKYAKDGEVTIAPAILASIESIKKLESQIYQATLADGLTSPATQARMKSAVDTLSGFLTMVGSYRSYLKSPQSSFSVPTEIASSDLVRLAESDMSSVSLGDLQDILPGLSSDLKPINGMYFIVKLPMQFKDKIGTIYPASLSGRFHIEKKELQSLQLLYKDIKITINPKGISLHNFRIYSSFIGNYLSILDDTLQKEGNIFGAVSFTLGDRTLMIGSRSLPVLGQ